MTVDEYYLAAEKGVFGAGERLELIWGEVVQLSPQKSLHAWATDNLGQILRECFPKTSVRQQFPLHLGEFNEPEPDVAVVAGPASSYMNHHPEAADTCLVVEVSDTTLRTDRTLKAGLYAQFGIPEYWIVDLNAKALEVRRDPGKDSLGDAAYASLKILGPDDEIVPLGAVNAAISVRRLLPE
jgi:Uma2 family endonuclease